MHSRIAALVLFIAVVAVQPGTAGADAKLALRVSPSITTAPADIVVTATVERHPDNRALEIAAESPDFFRSSLITLEGDRAPRVTQVSLRNLPGGEYDVVVVLHDSHGARTLEHRTVVVMPSLGDRR